MQRPELQTLSAAKSLSRFRLLGSRADADLDDLRWGSSLDGGFERLRGRSVLLAAENQFAAALALIELDGIARRLILCPPDLDRKHISSVTRTGKVDAVVSDDSMTAGSLAEIDCRAICGCRIVPAECDRNPSHDTEWVLLTSGTTGVPKMVVHSLSSLRGAIEARERSAATVWSTFYDIRRYGGLQILLRALLTGGSLILSDSEESTSDFLRRAAKAGVTHISGTPTQWRRALMSPAAFGLSPKYIRLSGEIVDQAILDSLKDFYPSALIVHAFASTEAGVAFDVCDGRAGFPKSLVNQPGGDVELAVREGSLRIRSARTATCYLERSSSPITDENGFVNTRDMVELSEDRYYFVGRRDGIINVGGLKVHPEEVEAAINRHPAVQMSLVKARRSPITGAVVVAEVVVKPEQSVGLLYRLAKELEQSILETCREALPPHKVPAVIRFVPTLPVAASGKLAR